jgi:hypothetical protein
VGPTRKSFYYFIPPISDPIYSAPTPPRLIFFVLHPDVASVHLPAPSPSSRLEAPVTAQGTTSSSRLQVRAARRKRTARVVRRGAELGARALGLTGCGARAAWRRWWLEVGEGDIEGLCRWWLEVSPVVAGGRWFLDLS